MGDRAGLTKLDRTNGYEDGRGYMRAKKAKLAQQNEQMREALRQRSNTMRTELFKGISINVNGRTQPSADELKRLILLNGGDYHPYYRYQTTKFMIATNLSMARIRTLRPDDRIVKPEWITDSIKVNCVLPYQDYQLFADSDTNELQLQMIDGNSNSSDHPKINSGTTSSAHPSNSLRPRSTSNNKNKINFNTNVDNEKKQRTLESFIIRGATWLKTRDTQKVASICSTANMRTELFKDISISVSGKTQPSADELKRLVLLNGGDYHPYYRYQTTKFMVATNLSMVHIKALRPDDIVVRPEWITDSVKVSCVLPYEDYQLFADSHTNELQLQIIDGNSSNHPKIESGPATSARPPNASRVKSSSNNKIEKNRNVSVDNKKKQQTLESFVIRGATWLKTDDKNI